MTILTIGTPVDVTGFALAGIDGVACSSAEEVAAALQTVSADVAVILVSPESAAIASAELDVFRRRHELPMLVVLPGHPAVRTPQAPEEVAS